MDSAHDDYTNQQFVFSQSFIPRSAQLLFFTDDVNNFSQETCLNAQFELFQQEPIPWASDSLPPDPALLVNVNDDFLGASRPDLVTAPSQSGLHSVYHATNGLNTIDVTPEDNVQVHLTDSVQETTPLSPLRCNEPGCDNVRVYLTASAFRKHQGKHSRPYACKHSSCNYRRFGDKAGLARHSREVHGAEVHYCPFISCNRHTKGFPRKYNLTQHQKNCHGDRQTRHANHSFDKRHRVSKSSSMEPLDHEVVHMELEQARSEDADRESDTESAVERSGACSEGIDRLEKKLRDLKAARAEINQDIATLERALGLVEDNSA